MNFIKKMSNYQRIIFLISFILVIFFYFYVLFVTNYYKNISNMIFEYDAYEYLDVGKWIIGQKESPFISIRPIFFPFIIIGFYSLLGSFGIWLYQFILWLLSSMFIFYFGYKITSSFYAALIGWGVFATNLTLMFLTSFPLSEITIIFLSCIFIYFVLNRQKYSSIHFWSYIFFITSLLTITKPVFKLLLFSLLLCKGALFFFNIKKYKTKLFFLLLAILPIIIQISIMRVKCDTYKISKIDTYTIKNYYFARLFSKINDISLVTARSRISEYDLKKMIVYSGTHYKEAFINYIECLLGGNILVGSQYINANQNSHLYFFSKISNYLYFFFHFIFFNFFLLILYKNIKMKLYKKYKSLLLVFLPLSIIFFTAGFAFYQRDRLVIIAMPFWITLYYQISNQLFDSKYLLRAYKISK